MSGKFAIVMVGFALFAVACIFWAIIRLVYQAAVRPTLAATGVLPTSAYDVEILAWKAERAGRGDEAVELYLLALELNPENHALRQKLQGMCDPAEVAGKASLRGVLAARLVDLPEGAWSVRDQLPLLQAYVGGRLVATAELLVARVGQTPPGRFRYFRTWPEVQRMRFRWADGGYGGCAEMLDYMSAAIAAAATES